MEEYFGYIYKTCEVNGDGYYIGQAWCSRHGPFLSKRGYLGSNKIVRAYKKKYGKNSLKVILLATANSLEELNLLEEKFIGDLWKTDPNCWNFKPGGNHCSGWKQTDEAKKRIAEKVSPIIKGRHYFNNGKINVMAYECPPGFVKGRLDMNRCWLSVSEETIQKRAKSLRGQGWYTNGVINIRAHECPPGFQRGMKKRADT